MLESLGTLQRPATGQGYAGGQTQSFANVGASSTNQPCSVQPATQKVRIEYAQRQTEVDTSIFWATNIGAQVGDIIIATNPSDKQQATFNVIGIAPAIFGRYQSPYTTHCQWVK